MDRINIGIFNDSFYPMIDGVVSIVDNMARLLLKNANVIVFVPDFKKEFDDSKLPYKVVRVKSIKIPKLDYVLPIPQVDKAFMRELEYYKLDIIHVHSPATLGLTGIKYAKKHNIPLVATMHSQFKQDFKNYTHSRILTSLGTKYIVNFFDKCDKSIAVNQGVADLFYNDYGCHKKPKVILSACDMKPVRNIKKACEIINERHGLDNNTKVFLFVGRLYKLKNILFIVDSMKELSKINPNLKYKMLFVGFGADEELLRKYVNTNHLNDKIVLCGKIEDRELLSYYYVRSDLFLFPSEYDTNSLVQKEAASQKKPTVFLENTITASDIINDETGFITSKDPKVYAQKINDVINDKKLYNYVANNAFKKVYRTWDDVVKETYDLYLELIKSKENDK